MTEAPDGLGEGEKDGLADVATADGNELVGLAESLLAPHPAEERSSAKVAAKAEAVRFIPGL
ncbi:hypothetical protein KBX50_08430 [Micromonospora sp. C51]|uniref:hypothetical protein n=1 Tax=Micromonospora sp. C51 TaxID=2824879 RepID=UPI001B37A350|nr:hypothetical protein [Micromonospora sp. C51]MBQ1048489.1 hypothetical protein [Micromonospora sp. C51]